MQAFLYDVAANISKGVLNKHVRLLFPTKRGKFYFRQYLGNIFNKATIYQRNLMTIEEFLLREAMPGWNVADELTLLLELYQVVKELPEHEQIRGTASFDKFYSLGKIILSDFNEVDKDLVPAGDIFRNMSDLKHIDAAFPYLSGEQVKHIRKFWSSFQTKNSEEQQHFLNLWERLPLIYKRFNERLAGQKIGYQGMIYRRFAECLKNENPLPAQRKYLAVGFNALNKAQEAIFKHLQKNGQLQFYWDGDIHYTKDKRQEAGAFLRKNINTFGPGALQAPANLNQAHKALKIHAVQGNIAQAKMVHQLLQEMPEEEVHHTAIVLGDEQLLFPVLSAIPPAVGAINVTMGYPFKHTSLYAFIKRYIALHTGFIKETGEGPAYYHEEVTALIRHPFLKQKAPDFVQDTLEAIYNKHLVYIPEARLMPADQPLFRLIFAHTNDAGMLFTNLLNILFELFPRPENDEDTEKTINREFIHEAYKAVQRLKDTLTGRLSQLHITTAVKLLHEHLSEMTIPFEAQSQEGLQIMGLMETRNIDFRHVILLNANEGTIPKITTPPTFINESLRFGFGLPVISQQDSIFAYVFYRLIQRAQSVKVLYNSLTNEDNTGEVSRFVKQLQHETRLNISTVHIKPQPAPLGRKAISIPKDDAVMELLRQFQFREGYAQNAISPSAINDYIACPLRFYFKKIAGLNEADEVEEEISASAFGNILHKTMQNLYKSLDKTNNGSEVTVPDIKLLTQKAENMLIASFKTQYEIPQDQSLALEGKQKVIFEVLKRYVHYILKTDKQHAPFKLHGLETGVPKGSYMPVETPYGSVNVAFNGIIDRIDEKNGVLRIIDYKTGNANRKLTQTANLFTPKKNKEKKAIIQILQYAWLYHNRFYEWQGKIKPILYAVKDMPQPGFTGELEQDKGPLSAQSLKAVIEAYREHLHNMLGEMFNPDVPFNQTTDYENCTYCPYNTICSTVKPD